jgi:hypothetical protein
MFVTRNVNETTVHQQGVPVLRPHDGRVSTLEVANAAVLMASDRVGAITGAVTNITCGMSRKQSSSVWGSAEAAIEIIMIKEPTTDMIIINDSMRELSRLDVVQ